MKLVDVFSHSMKTVHSGVERIVFGVKTQNLESHQLKYGVLEHSVYTIFTHIAPVTL